MDLPDIVKERLIELEEDNNQLKADLKRQRDKCDVTEAMLLELEQEVQRLSDSQKENRFRCAKCPLVEQTIQSLKCELEEKSIDSSRMSREIENLSALLNAAREEIDELRRARTPISADQSFTNTSSDSSKLILLKEERDDAIYELETAKRQISALESEKKDYAEREEALVAEAQELRRHLKEAREQLSQNEAERMASLGNIGIANRGNSMFAEFAEERVKLETDMKSLYSKYLAVRRENCRLSNDSMRHELWLYDVVETR
ncbi:hypothetical protein KIN20_008821 [Parelaphostrongylus tenuis]|uniref:Uncharacterized protein n=1 Tax=Parelaphostrongylus tenuis TaxID=148309 RepID=A0AAD5QK44_PARTN|nr:hypothetical protein KIN20_008821 [Parelaphostrongylus tenuis]